MFNIWYISPSQVKIKERAKEGIYKNRNED